MTWNPLREPIDWVDFAGQSTPGLAELIGVGAPRRWEERESYGYSGAYLVYRGQSLARFSVRLRLYNADHWLGWHRFKPIVDRVPIGKIARPVDIVHPLLGLHGIRSCVIEDVVGPEHVDLAVWQIDIKCIEYRSPRYALAAAKGAKATPEDPEEARVRDLTQQWDALGTEIEDALRGGTQ